MGSNKKRCDWCLEHNIFLYYHDNEWGSPEHDERALFEKLILHSQEAGIGLAAVLRRRETLREAYAQWVAEEIAEFGEDRVNVLLKDDGVIRNEQKIRSVIANAQAYLHVCEEYESFNAFIWAFVDDHPVINIWSHPSQVPERNIVSEVMSEVLKEKGFKIISPEICYRFMQAVGLVDDHLSYCFRKD